MEKTYKKFIRPNLVVTALVLIAIVAGAWYAYHVANNESSSSSGSSSVKLATYKNQQYKFQFTYPVYWGAPKVQVSAFGPGKEYTIVFMTPTTDKSKVSTQNKNVYIVMDSEVVAKSVCDSKGECQTVPVVTSAYIQQQLTKSKLSYVAAGNGSFATISSGNGMNHLTIYRNVSLSSLNISAARGYYAKKQIAKKCPQDKFGQDSLGCISQATYDQLNSTLVSMKVL